ncbi:MAG: hypothetical protein QGF00_16445, partial [Planctomycetota bacterium]|nr:hypothetical protein [Planctomycetota bacterium]
MNILTTLHRLTWRHPFLILTVAFITGLVCLNFIRTLKLDSSLKSLYPQNSPSINRLLDLNRRYGG